MSDKGLGDIALSVYNHLNNPNRRPYLKRNVRKALRSLSNMGSAGSVLRSSARLGSREESMASDEEDGPRPMKRRKLFDNRTTSAKHDGDDDDDDDEIFTRRPVGQVTSKSNGAPSPSSKPEAIKPSNFYGKPKTAPPPLAPGSLTVRPITSKNSIRRILPETLVNFFESMRIDIHHIDPSYDEEVSDDRGQEAIIPCRCFVSIFYANNDKKSGDVDSRDLTIICKDVKACTLRVSIGYDGTVRREVVLPEPFIFSPTHFYVNRRKDINGRSIREFGFADKYQLQIKLEPMGSHEAWPPLGAQGPVSDLIEQGTISPEDTHLHCKTNPFADADQHAKLDLQLCYKTIKQAIQFSLEIQIRWASPSHLSEIRARNTKIAAARMSASFPGASEISKSPIARRAEDITAHESPGDSRVPRRRTAVTTYNLKTLSSMAQRRSPKAPRTKRSERRNLDSRDITVTYSFNRAEAAEAGIKRETTISGLDCPFCLSRNSSLEELRLHLHTDHGAFKFHLRRPDPPLVTYYIELVKNNRPGPAFPHELQRTIQMGLPVSLFDLEKYIGGDESWAKARNGSSQPSLLPPHLQPQAPDASSSPSPHESRHSSPNTSNDTDDMVGFENCEPKAQLPIFQRRVFYAPTTTKPLYEATTKRLLKPGDELPRSDDETDEAWLHQSQRDGLNDFTDEDVLPEEKDFMHRWNSFVVNEHLTSDKYLATVVVRFVEANKAWLVEKTSRRKEFMKQAENFILKGIFDERHLRHCLGVIEEERKAIAAREVAERKEDVDMDRMDEDEKEAPPTRSLHTCVCGEYQPLDRVTCRGTSCKSRFFCRPCAQKCGRSLVGAWKCDDCNS
ncbi:hypothetical protein LZ554_002896 [Drepanopeziza brunnea f. sp. 'monogermtubi']|nr:hypothetical protein LZ554_002896 [Drepanopeziza brunnea f. sp. 'monogermtubi']